MVEVVLRRVRVGSGKSYTLRVKCRATLNGDLSSVRTAFPIPRSPAPSSISR
jgi:hypothetical protein